MTNKNRAIIHFLVGFISAIIAAGTFILLIISNVNLGNIVNEWDYFAVSFVSSLVFFGLIYGILTISLSQGSKPIRMLLPWALTTFIMSVLIALISVGIYWSDINFSPLQEISKLLLNIFLFILILVSVIIILIISQIYNTKFLLISTAKGRSDEWDISNFFQMLISKTNIKHKKNYSILYSKKRKLLIKFIPEEEIERRINLSGELISKDVNELRKGMKQGDKAAIVFLSNNLPTVQGKDDNIIIIKNENLFNEFKKINSLKGKNNEKS